MKGNAIVTWTDSNLNKSDKRLPNVNPAYLPNFGSDTVATNSAVSIRSACQALAGLTSNTITNIAVGVEIDISDVEGENNG